MKNSYKYIPLLFILFFSACKNDSALEYALNLSGKNRKELQKVIEFYSKQEKDSLKLRAAKFLIENMPYYNHYENQKLAYIKDRLYTTVKERSIYTKEAVSLLEKEIGAITPADYIIKNDVEVITSDYLINHIEHAFGTWEKSPWRKHISFSVFCEEVLPYRIGNEPVEDWREAYYNKFSPLLDTLLVDNDPVTACQILYDAIIKEDWIFTTDLHYPHLGALTLLKNRIGGCTERCDYALYAMRALGIPGGIDMILQNPDKMYKAHYWNYVTDTLGNHIDFTLYEHKPESGVRDNSRKKGKVYRIHFTPQADFLPLLYPQAEIPTTLNNRFISDVSSEYGCIHSLTFSVNNDNHFNNKLLYLCVFDNRQWIPVDWANIDNGKATFNNLEANITYLPAFFEGKVVQAGYPAIITDEGCIDRLMAEHENSRDIRLYRKHPKPNWWDSYSVRAIGGKFQVADNKEFKNPLTLYTINDKDEMKFCTIDIDTNNMYRYARYLSGENGYCNMAEVKFISNGNTLKGTVIGTEGAYMNSKSRTKHAVFDNDPLTFYDAKEASGAWAGLDFGEPVHIDRIKYLFRSDDNNIREGDLYELFYYSMYGIESLGQQVGTDSGELIYENVPSNALLLLRNHTRGREERIFTYDEEEQKWW